MSSPNIETFLFDEENEDKITNHGLSTYRVLQLLDNTHVIIPNRKRRKAKYLVIGRDNGGTCISVPIEPTHQSGIWRPITAWPSKKSEETILGKNER
jgi:uncharacterized DUF497 family protein